MYKKIFLILLLSSTVNHISAGRRRSNTVASEGQSLRDNVAGQPISDAEFKRKVEIAVNTALDKRYASTNECAKNSCTLVGLGVAAYGAWYALRLGQVVYYAGRVSGNW